MSEHEHPHGHSEIHLASPGYLSFSRQVHLGILGTAAAGGIGAVLTTLLYTDGMRRLMLAYLVAVAFVLSISLGSLFFILIQHLTRAGWAVLIRRPAEVFALNVITVGVLAIPIVVFAFNGSASIYPGPGELSARQRYKSSRRNIHDYSQIRQFGWCQLRPIQVAVPTKKAIEGNRTPKAL
jgi:hypothetical protein